MALQLSAFKVPPRREEPEDLISSMAAIAEGGAKEVYAELTEAAALLE